ncbi:hypothetical protein GCM10027418_07320 [Mariniluteicoccus endophyticus]
MRVLSIPGILATAAALAACTPSPAQPTPTPTATSTPAATPTTSPTLSAEDLSKQAGQAYETAFAEFERLSRAGGADQPTAKMLEVETDLYLKQDMALLQNQRATKFKVQGTPSTAKWRPATDQAKNGSDQRLTIQICEDRRGSAAVYADGRREESTLAQGYAYAKIIDGKVKLVDVDTKKVERCDW